MKSTSALPPYTSAICRLIALYAALGLSCQTSPPPPRPKAPSSPSSAPSKEHVEPEALSIKAKGPTSRAASRPTPSALNKVRVVTKLSPAGHLILPLGLTTPSSGPALARFFQRLEALRTGRRDRVRVSVWGASHIAGEAFTGQLRRRFQRDYGDGGPGFVVPGRPWRSYRHSTVKLQEVGRWRSERIWSRYSRKRRKPRDDLFGLGGISVHTRWDASASIALRKRRPLAALELYYLAQPQGGQVDVYADGRRLERVRTRRTRGKRGVFARIGLPKKTKQVEVRARGGEVRIFGVDLQSGERGVVVDAFGINGGRVDRLLEWNEALAKVQIRRLAPDLMILAYGSNSVDNNKLTPLTLRRHIGAAIDRMRRAAPEADCLFIGPADQARKDQAGEWRIPENLGWIITAQRKATHAKGCAYWDWREVMGGKESVFSAVAAEPPLVRKDHLHFFYRGYLLYADAFYEALMAFRARGQGAPAQREMRKISARVDPQRAPDAAR